MIPPVCLLQHCSVLIVPYVFIEKHRTRESCWIVATSLKPEQTGVWQFRRRPPQRSEGLNIYTLGTRLSRQRWRDVVTSRRWRSEHASAAREIKATSRWWIITLPLAGIARVVVIGGVGINRDGQGGLRKRARKKSAEEKKGWGGRRRKKGMRRKEEEGDGGWDRLFRFSLAASLLSPSQVAGTN